MVWWTATGRARGQPPVVRAVVVAMLSVATALPAWVLLSWWAVRSRTW